MEFKEDSLLGLQNAKQSERRLILQEKTILMFDNVIVAVDMEHPLNYTFLHQSYTLNQGDMAVDTNLVQKIYEGDEEYLSSECLKPLFWSSREILLGYRTGKIAYWEYPTTYDSRIAELQRELAK